MATSQHKGFGMERRTMHILLVEDNQNLVELMLRAFEPFADEFRFTVVPNLAEAHQSLVDVEPSLLLIGTGLPDGQQAADIQVASLPVLSVALHERETDAGERAKTEDSKSDAALAEIPHIARETIRQWEQKSVGEADGTLTQCKEKLSQLEAELVHLSRVNSMGEMATVLAHELNQPLTAMAVYAATCAELLAGKQINYEELRQSLAQIDRHVRHAGEITKRLNRFVAKSPPKKSSVDLNQLVGDACDLMAYQIRLQQAELQLTLTDALPNVHVDEIQVRQVLVNLLQNAIEAMENVGENERQIMVTTKKSNDVVQVVVCDRGRGISEELRNKLFEPYFTTKRDRLGMGLTISRRIIESHGGKLTAEAHPDGGTIFQFTLPIESSR